MSNLHGYPEEWVAAVSRGLSNLVDDPGRIHRHDCYEILDHIVPLIRQDTIQQVNQMLNLSGSPLEVEIGDDRAYVTDADAEKQYSFTRTALEMRPWPASNEGSVAGADMGELPFVNRHLEARLHALEQAIRGLAAIHSTDASVAVQDILTLDESVGGTTHG